MQHAACSPTMVREQVQTCSPICREELEGSFFEMVQHGVLTSIGRATIYGVDKAKHNLAP